jgi:hypothetical protein
MLLLSCDRQVPASRRLGLGRVVVVKDPDGKWHEVVLEQRDVEKKAAKVLDELCTWGLDLTVAEKAGQAVKDLLAAWCPSRVHDRVTHPAAKCTPRARWTVGGITGPAGIGKFPYDPSLVPCLHRPVALGA